MRYAVIALGAIGIIVGAVMIPMQAMTEIGMLAILSIIAGIGTFLAGGKLRAQQS